MADIRLVNVSKQFGSVRVIENVTMTIGSGEFMVFLGPSGCGKSTLLRMIAGLEEIDGGEIHIGDRRVDALPPSEREIAMVFQNYALYPHMSVRENMSFGLQNIRMPRDEIARRVAAAAKTLELEHLIDRKPGQLSGGQRQRVAIGRAIVRDPKAFLFDEPLSNLDAGLRVRTRIEFAQLHQRMKTTMIFVTHDQIEAMTLADRIVVMNNRKIEQIGTPMEIYNRPASRFVAAFVGSPSMNFLPVQQISDRDGKVLVRLPDNSEIQTNIVSSRVPDDGKVTFGIRPESVKVSATGAISGKADVVERLGERTLAYVRLADNSVLIAEDEGQSNLNVGDQVRLDIDGASAHLFDARDVAYSAA
ncbi:MAG: sn-glycerol-3-phosphate ABC transporter ATP-binding protein UgpC [Devosia sp.]|uniref:ABC transporter ATP-binding protein n=1 Tax=Devosia sp. TaxID=1871048 RepID=UPI001AC0E615|nr:sn-glycerol-3-phosphate ABC transporter ATP-binding protein UgpC [Devosia sp.]MBN9315407.1 sn-glycerol-3-phosphate ABC transporter ATP-binding protein UgpC [Devosia sp.]